jgi:hypothetical protein
MVDPCQLKSIIFEFQKCVGCVSFILSVVRWWVGINKQHHQHNAPTPANTTMAVCGFDRCLLATGCMSLMLLAPTVVSLVVLPPPPLSPAVGAAVRNGWIGLSSSSSLLNDGATAWLRTTTTMEDTSSIFVANEEPTSEDIVLLRQAFSESNARNYDSAVKLFDTVIMKWVDQPVDERAALYRSRADCYMGLGDASAAYADYDSCLKLLQKDIAGAADPAELPTALLGRARAGLAGGADSTSAKKKKNAAAQQIAADYQQALVLLGADEYDDEQTELEALTAAAKQNPYAMWEYGAALRNAGRANGAIRLLAATSFASIGDPARSVIAQIDAGIDYASSGDIVNAESTLAKAIEKSVGVESRDVRLLQRVITKEGEGRLALAALYWSDNQKAQAETVLGDACVRLDQLSNQMDGAAATATSQQQLRPANNNKLRYSIDDNDDALVGSLTCSRFKNKDFLTNTLGWPQSLQEQVLQLQLVQK